MPFISRSFTSRLHLPLALAVLGAMSLPRAAMASGLDAPMVGSGQSGPTTRDGAKIQVIVMKVDRQKRLIDFTVP